MSADSSQRRCSGESLPPLSPRILRFHRGPFCSIPTALFAGGCCWLSHQACTAHSPRVRTLWPHIPACEQAPCLSQSHAPARAQPAACLCAATLDMAETNDASVNASTTQAKRCKRNGMQAPESTASSASSHWRVGCFNETRTLQGLALQDFGQCVRMFALHLAGPDADGRTLKAAAPTRRRTRNAPHTHGTSHARKDKEACGGGQQGRQGVPGSARPGPVTAAVSPRRQIRDPLAKRLIAALAVVVQVTFCLARVHTEPREGTWQRTPTGGQHQPRRRRTVSRGGCARQGRKGRGGRRGHRG